jgi:alkylation response protein AidB-like acyl-CoA dehydrogenase
LVKIMAKQVTITIETNSVVVLRARASGRVWCNRCGTEGKVLTLGLRTQAENRGWAVLRELIARTDVHHEQAPDGSALICLDSLMRFIHDRLQSRGNLRANITKVEEI